MKLIKYLKQQTPIIHFQHDQTGATLRATEVKPKLDRWIKEQYGKPIPKAWKVGQHEALNYKLKILPDGKGESWHIPTSRKSQSGKLDSVAPMYLGDQGVKSEADVEKHLVFYTGKIRVELLVPNEELRKFIDARLGNFFFLHNFGTRQNKGYGSFCALDDIGQPEGLTAQHPYLSIAFSSNLDEKNYKRVFEVIQYYYQRLKSGVNLKDRHYKKAYLYYYLEEQKHNENWEKAWIKSEVVDIDPVYPIGQKYTPKFYRALLGLGDSMQFLGYEKAKFKRKGHKESEYPPGKKTVKVTIKHKKSKIKEISRIKSPISFKPIKVGDRMRIYVVPTGFETWPLNEEFSFKGKEDYATIKTPATKIDIADLISKYNEHLNHAFPAYDYSMNKIADVKIHK